MFPTQKRIELFARHKPKGWDVWGLDVREEFEEKKQSTISQEHSSLSDFERRLLQDMVDDLD